VSKFKQVNFYVNFEKNLDKERENFGIFNGYLIGSAFFNYPQSILSILMSLRPYKISDLYGIGSTTLTI
jgi:hypothetical protein